MELVTDNGVYGILYKGYRLALYIMPSGIIDRSLNGNPYSDFYSGPDAAAIKRLFKQLERLILGLFTEVTPLTSMDRFRIAYRVLLSEAEQVHEPKLVKSLRYRLSEIDRCLTSNSSKLVFH